MTTSPAELAKREAYLFPNGIQAARDAVFSRFPNEKDNPDAIAKIEGFIQGALNSPLYRYFPPATDHDSFMKMAACVEGLSFMQPAERDTLLTAAEQFSFTARALQSEVPGDTIAKDPHLRPRLSVMPGRGEHGQPTYDITVDCAPLMDTKGFLRLRKLLADAARETRTAIPFIDDGAFEMEAFGGSRRAVIEQMGMTGLVDQRPSNKITYGMTEFIQAAGAMLELQSNMQRC